MKCLPWRHDFPDAIRPNRISIWEQKVWLVCRKCGKVRTESFRYLPSAEA